MYLCSVNINSKGAGWSDWRASDGEIFETAKGTVIRYALDGDRCELTLSDGKVMQTRRGEQCVTICFEEGKQTECIIGSGGFTGSFKIFTKSLKILSGKGGYRITIEYLSGVDGELINLSFTAMRKGNKI